MPREKNPANFFFPTIKERVRFEREWQETTVRVLKGLRRKVGGPVGQSSGKVFCDR